MEAPVEKEEMGVTINMDNGENNFVGESFRHFEDREENRRPRRSRDFEERDSRRLEEHEKRMSMLEASLHELYPTSAITVQKNQEEDPVPSIKKWTNDDIPMEKFQTDGVSQLSESELLAIIIGNGPKEFPTVDLMNQMLDDCGNDLSKLGKKTMEELMCYRGIGKNRAIAIVAACEFGKRFRKTAPEEKPVLKNALAIGDYMMPQLEDLDVEEFWALFLNPKHELLRRVRICRGEVCLKTLPTRGISCDSGCSTMQLTLSQYITMSVGIPLPQSLTA